MTMDMIHSHIEALWKKKPGGHKISIEKLRDAQEQTIY
jgi:hypothetical protein